MSIEGKVALVTGGSGGLGSSHCLALARAGCHVAVGSHAHPEKAEAVSREIEGLGRKAIAIQLDLGDFAGMQRAVRQIEETLGPVDILVNNAATGIVRAVTIAKMDIDDWQRDIVVNLNGPFYTIKCCMPGMTERGWGRIINISSIAGSMGGMGQCSYAAAKAGIIGLTKTAALEGARKGVTCNALVLGAFDAGGFHQVAPEFRERIVKRIALRRAGQPQELSDIIVFLASEASSYLTGEAIEVSGGASLFTF